MKRMHFLLAHGVKIEICQENRVSKIKVSTRTEDEWVEGSLQTIPHSSDKEAEEFYQSFIDVIGSSIDKHILEPEDEEIPAKREDLQSTSE